MFSEVSSMMRVKSPRSPPSSTIYQSQISSVISLTNSTSRMQNERGGAIIWAKESKEVYSLNVGKTWPHLRKTMRKSAQRIATEREKEKTKERMSTDFES